MGRELVQHKKNKKWTVVETVSGEDNPVMPWFKTKEEVANYLVEHGEDTPMRKLISREAADAFIEVGWVPSMIGGRLGMLCNYDCALEMKKEKKNG